MSLSIKELTIDTPEYDQIRDRADLENTAYDNLDVASTADSYEGDPSTQLSALCRNRIVDFLGHVPDNIIKDIADETDAFKGLKTSNLNGYRKLGERVTREILLQLPNEKLGEIVRQTIESPGTTPLSLSLNVGDGDFELLKYLSEQTSEKQD